MQNVQDVMPPAPAAPSNPSPGPEAVRARPALRRTGRPADNASEAAGALVADLQAGWDLHDADVADRRFADDVLWGSPFGVTVRGYDALHAIHVDPTQQGQGGPSSRFELLDVTSPVPDVAIAQVLRVALDASGRAVDPTADLTGPFSELALYVLARRDDTWWVVACHNTPVTGAPSP